MFGLGAGEIVVILIVALLVLGPTQLPNAAKEIGKAIRTLRKHTRDLQDTIDKDETIGGTVRELKSALRGDELYREPLLPSKPGPVIPPPEDEKPMTFGNPGTQVAEDLQKGDSVGVPQGEAAAPPAETAAAPAETTTAAAPPAPAPETTTTTPPETPRDG